MDNSNDEWQKRNTVETIERLEQELELLRKLHLRMVGEIRCRVDHGAESNGHLEGILHLYDAKWCKEILGDDA